MPITSRKIKIKRKYRDNDITDYINLYIRSKLGGYKIDEITNAEYSYVINNEYFDVTDNNNYIVAIFPAIDTQELASPIAFYLNKNLQSLPVVQDDRKDVFDELMPILQTKEVAHIKILFPYNISQFHWLTGEILIYKNGQKYELEIFAHNPYGGGSMEELNCAQIASTFNRIKDFDPTADINIQNVRKESTYLQRQKFNDVVSCGAIVAHDLLERAQGHSLTRDEGAYPIGAEALRKEQMELFLNELPDSDVTRIHFLGRNTILSTVGTLEVFDNLIDEFKIKYSNTHPKIIEDIKKLAKAIEFIDKVILNIQQKNVRELQENLKNLGATIKLISHSSADQSIYMCCQKLEIHLKTIAYFSKIFARQNEHVKFINIDNDFVDLKKGFLHIIAGTIGEEFLREKYIPDYKCLIDSVVKPSINIDFLKKFISLEVMLFSCNRIIFALKNIQLISEQDIQDEVNLHLSRQKRYIFGNAVIALGESAKELRDHLELIESEALSNLLKALGNFRDLVKIRPQIFVDYTTSIAQLIRILKKHEPVMSEVFKALDNFIKPIFLTKYLNYGSNPYNINDKKVMDASEDFKIYYENFNAFIEREFVMLCKYAIQLNTQENVETRKKFTDTLKEYIDIRGNHTNLEYPVFNMNTSSHDVMQAEFHYKQNKLQNDSVKAIEKKFATLCKFAIQSSKQDDAITRKKFTDTLTEYIGIRGNHINLEYPIFNVGTQPQDVVNAETYYKQNKEKLRLQKDLEIVIAESEFQEKILLEMNRIPDSITIDEKETSVAKITIAPKYREVMLFSQAIVGTRYYFINDENQYPIYCKILRKKQHPLLAQTFKELRDLRMNSLMHGDNEDIKDYDLFISSNSITIPWVEDVKALKIIITSDIEQIKQDIFDANDIDKLSSVTKKFVKFYESTSRFESVLDYKENLYALVKKFNDFADNMQEAHYKAHAKLLHIYACSLLDTGEIDSAINEFKKAYDLKKKYSSQNVNLIATTEDNLMTLLRNTNRQREYEDILLAVEVDRHPLAHSLIGDKAELMYRKDKPDEAIILLTNAIKKYESTRRPIFQFHLLLAKIYFNLGGIRSDQVKYLSLARQHFIKAEKHFDHDQDYLKRFYGQKYLEYYADFSENYTRFLLYVREYGATIVGLTDALQKFDIAKVEVHNRKLLEMYLLEARIYEIEDNFLLAIENNQLLNFKNAESYINDLDKLKEKVIVLPSEYQQRTQCILYRSLYNVFIGTIKELNEEHLKPIPSMFKKFAEELTLSIKNNKPNLVNNDLKQITLEFLYRAAIFRGAAEEAITYIEELNPEKYPNSFRAANLRLLGQAHLVIAKNIANSKASNEYNTYQGKARDYLRQALALEQQVENIEIIINYLAECVVTVVDSNLVNIAPIVEILTRKVGVVVARQNLRVINGEEIKILEKIKINSFSLDKLANQEDENEVCTLIFAKLKTILGNALLSTDFKDKKIVITINYNAAKDIYLRKYYPGLLASELEKQLQKLELHNNKNEKDEDEDKEHKSEDTASANYTPSYSTVRMPIQLGRIEPGPNILPDPVPPKNGA